MVMALPNRRIPLLRYKLSTWEHILRLPGMAIAVRADRGVYTDGAALFTAANKEFLYRTDPADLDFGTGDFAFSFNFYRTTTGEQAIGSKRQDANNNWLIDINASGQLEFIAASGGLTRALVRGSTNLSTTGAWYHAVILVDRDLAGGTQIWINGVNDTGGTPTANATSIDNTGDFHLGDDGNAGQHWDGRLDSFLVTKRLLTAAEIAALYNNGKGVSWDEIEAGAGDLATINDASLVAFYELDEADGVDRADSKGSNTLTPSGANLVTNGTFDADTDWTKGAGWTIDTTDSNVAEATAAGGALSQTVTGDVQSGKKYLITYTIVHTAGSIRPLIGGTAGTTRSSSLTVTNEEILGGSGDELISFLTPGASWTGTLDDVSLISFGPSWAVGVQSTGQVNDDGDIVGTIVNQKGGHLFQQSTLTKRFTWQTGIFGAQPGLLADGVDDLMVLASAILSGTKGYVFALVKFSASPSDFQDIISSADEGTTTNYWIAEGFHQAATPNIAYFQKDNDTTDSFRGSSALTDGVSYIMSWQSNGLAGGISMKVGAVNQTLTTLTGSNTGDWVGDVTLRDNTVIGALKRSSEGDFFKGYIGVLLVGDGATLTAQQARGVERWLNSWAGGGVV